MKVYKLTDKNNETYNNTKWGENVTHETDGSGDLCGPGWLHFYTSAELAILMNPVHASISSPKLWEAEAEGKFKDDFGRKGGCTKLTTTKEISIPNITTNQKIAFAILCGLEVYKDEKFQKWANEWLENKDRSADAANAAANAANAAVDAAYAAANAAANAADAAYAANAAANAAVDAAYAANAANAADAANAAYAAANAAANAADAAYAANAADAAYAANAADAANAAYAAANAAAYTAAYAAANAAANAANAADYVFDFPTIIKKALIY